MDRPRGPGWCCCCGAKLNGLNGATTSEWCDWCNEDRCWGIDENGDEVSYHG